MTATNYTPSVLAEKHYGTKASPARFALKAELGGLSFSIISGRSFGNLYIPRDWNEY